MHDRKTTLKEKLLLFMLPEGIATKDALFCLYPERSYVRRVYGEMLQKNYIAERQVKIKSRPRSYIVKYLVITRNGIRYLLQNRSGIDLLDIVVPDDFRVRKSFSNNYIERVLRNKTCEAVALMTDRTTLGHLDAKPEFPQQRIETDKEKIKTIEDVLFDDLSIEDDLDYEVEIENEIIEEIEDDDIAKPAMNEIFQARLAELHHTQGNALEIDELLKEHFAIFYTRDVTSMTSLTEKDVRQFNFSSHCGIFVGAEKAIIMYASKRYGINNILYRSAKRLIVNTESQLAKMGYNKGLLRPITDCAIVYHNNYELKYIIEQIEKRGSIFAQPYKTVWILKCNQDGASKLKTALISKTNVEEIAKEIKNLGGERKAIII